MRWIVTIGLGLGLSGGALLFFANSSAEGVGGMLQESDPQIVTLGAELYLVNCASCHGANLEGQPDWRIRGPDGRLPAPPHDETGHTWHHDSDTLFRLTKYGIVKLIDDPGYVTNMPIYDEILTDKEILSILSYIKSTWPPEIRDRHDAMDERQ
ncbi:cytochrome c [Roseovarius sp. M141]|uniref:c-type cytochrome n=1 Tax=Roseovarius sp. M141 TaxID=2583806 RepID=UPI0020CF7F06|nr:cytochrome c [Roseovarius sp. M141]MCQ0092987.1 cytochrome c [Roseovarius sp. M141]